MYERGIEWNFTGINGIWCDTQIIIYIYTPRTSHEHSFPCVWTCGNVRNCEISALRLNLSAFCTKVRVVWMLAGMAGKPNLDTLWTCARLRQIERKIVRGVALFCDRGCHQMVQFFYCQPSKWRCLRVWLNLHILSTCGRLTLLYVFSAWTLICARL